VATVAFALHVAALTLAPISIGQAVLAGGLVFLAVLAERFFGFELGRPQWIGIAPLHAYNFARVHRTLKTTPAMAAGVADHKWTLREIAALLD
jgi:hypothetical protein